ncbi:MAG: IPTL-CTERM sorting domain-containing protein, partial [Dokdonella sp.]
APTTTGTSSFTVTAVDSAGCEASRNYTIVVAPQGCPLITLSPTTLPAALIGVPFTQSLLASGGTPPYTFAVTAGATPPGVPLSPQGVLAGTPTTLGNFNFTVTAADAASCPASQPYSLQITNGGGPGGPGDPPIALPTLSTWAMLLLALLFIGVAGLQRRGLATHSKRT